MRIVGRGPNLSRAMTQEEAAEAFAMILDGRADPAQVGAFLAVLRVRGETAEEIAGFVTAARARLAPAPIAADLDWPSYADRHRQQPWFVLAALLLAANGVRVLMHGISGSSEGFAPTRPVLAGFGIEPKGDLAGAQAALDRGNFAYLATEHLSPPLAGLFALRPVLGIRTAVNSLARALNPADAPAQMIGVFHPPYRVLHRRVAELAGQPAAAVFTGGGGEAQRNPLKPCKVALVRNGAGTDTEWPALLPDLDYRWREEDLDPLRVTALWRGELDLPAPIAAITGTAALALHILGRADTAADAQTLAQDLWAERNRRLFASAA